MTFKVLFNRKLKTLIKTVPHFIISRCADGTLYSAKGSVEETQKMLTFSLLKTPELIPVFEQCLKDARAQIEEGKE